MNFVWSNMDLFSQQIGLVDECLRACVFSDYIWKQNPPQDSAWLSIADMCYSDLVMSWNSLFGQDNQETHWKKFVNKITFSKDLELKLFDKKMLLLYLNITESEWAIYHKEMVNTRNVRIAHLNISKTVEQLPNITIAMHCCYFYRDWLMELLQVKQKEGLQIKISQQRAKDAVNIYSQQIKSAYTGL